MSALPGPGTLLYPGKVIGDITITSVDPGEIGIVTPDTRERSGPSAQISFTLPDKYVGLIGRHRYAATDIRKGLVFCGPDGSGRRSLATAIAALHGLGVVIINFAKFVTKWVGETETTMLKAIQSNTDAGKVTLLVGMPEDAGETTTAIVNSVYTSINDKLFVWPILQSKPSKLSSYNVINLGYGTHDEVRDWCRWYFRDEHLASQLTKLRILPSLLSGIRCPQEKVVNEVKRRVLGDRLAPKLGELRMNEWEAYFLEHLPLMREPCRKKLWRARNEPGVLFYGTGGSGKSYAYHILARSGRVRTGDTIDSLREAKFVWEMYGEESPMYLIFYDECNKMFAEVPSVGPSAGSSSQREDFLQLIGSADSPHNVFIVATTNVPLDQISAPIWRTERLVPIELGCVTEEEFREYKLPFRWIEGISFAALMKIIEQETREEQILEFYKSLDLKYLDHVLTDEEAASAIKSYPKDIRQTVLKIRGDVLERKNQVIRIPLHLRDPLQAVFDVTLVGKDCVKRLAAYSMLEEVPLALILIKESDVPEIQSLPEGVCMCVVRVEVTEYT